MPHNESPVHIGARQQQAAARKAQILESALGLFARQGFDATSTKQIARAAGIAEGLIFHYFPTKAHLLTALLEARHAFMGDLRTGLAGAQQQPAREVLRRLALDWLASVRREAAMMTIVFSMAQTHEEVRNALHALIDEGCVRLGLYLAGRVQAGELRPDLPVKNAALLFFSPLMMFFLTYRQVSEAEWHMRAAVYVDDMLALWLGGATRRDRTT